MKEYKKQISGNDITITKGSHFLKMYNQTNWLMKLKSLSKRIIINCKKDSIIMQCLSSKLPKQFPTIYDKPFR